MGINFKAKILFFSYFKQLYFIQGAILLLCFFLTLSKIYSSSYHLNIFKNPFFYIGLIDLLSIGLTVWYLTTNSKTAVHLDK